MAVIQSLLIMDLYKIKSSHRPSANEGIEESYASTKQTTASFHIRECAVLAGANCSH